MNTYKLDSLINVSTLFQLFAVPLHFEIVYKRHKNEFNYSMQQINHNAVSVESAKRNENDEFSFSVEMESLLQKPKQMHPQERNQSALTTSGDCQNVVQKHSFRYL